MVNGCSHLRYYSALFICILNKPLIPVIDRQDKKKPPAFHLLKSVAFLVKLYS